MVSDKAFVELSKPYVDRYLFTHMHIMMVLHDALFSEQLYTDEERELMLQNSIQLNGHDVRAAYHLKYSLDLEDGSYTYFNWGNNYLYFWARRWYDGTIDQFYDILRTVFLAYYPDYEFDLDNYMIEDEWFDPRWNDETEEYDDPMSMWYWDSMIEDTLSNEDVEPGSSTDEPEERLTVPTI